MRHTSGRGWRALLCAALLGACGEVSAPFSKDTVNLTHGPFEIRIEGRRISAGGFPNNTGNPFGRMDVTGFTVRHGGKPVVVAHGERRIDAFWRVLRLVDAPRPALLVSTTDFHLLSDVDGKLVVQSFGEPSTNLAELQWLDAREGQPSEVFTYGIQQVDPDAGTTLQGGRWLKLGYHTVLDVANLRAHAIEPWERHQPGRARDGFNGSGNDALAFSPGRTQFAQLASRIDTQRRGSYEYAIMSLEIATGAQRILALSLKSHRFVDSSDATPAWFAHHFHWRRDAQGQEVLSARDGVKPLPWRGHWSAQESNKLDYKLRAARPELLSELARFITQKMGATVTADWLAPDKRSGNTFTYAGCDGVLVISQHQDEVALFAVAPADRPMADCRPAVRAIGEAFDAELASGRLDAHFLEE